MRVRVHAFPRSSQH
jgi:hypothetical protein